MRLSVFGQEVVQENTTRSSKFKSREYSPTSRMGRGSIKTLTSVPRTRNSLRSIKSKRSVPKSKQKVKTMRKFNTKMYMMMMFRPKDIIKSNMKQKIPIQDQVHLMVHEIVEDLFESAFEKADTREYLRKAPKTINTIIGCFLDLSISSELLHVEREELAANNFGENAGFEPKPCEIDNWIRNYIKVKKIDPVKRNRLDSDSTISRQMRMLGDKKTVYSNTTKEKTNYGRRSFKSHYNRRRRNMLPEPVEIDNYVEEDYITKERKTPVIKIKKTG